MSEKKINKITVKELTELADVNRATFYLYYKDVFDMVEKIETEMFQYFRDTLEKFVTKDSSDENILSLLNYVFEYIEEYSGLCRILLGPNGDYAFVEKLKKVIDPDYDFVAFIQTISESSFHEEYIGNTGVDPESIII
jgi:AcrR family transcriptional regulator